MYTIALLLLASTPAATSGAMETSDDGGGGGASTSARSTADGWGYHAGSLQLFLYAPPLTAQYTVNTPGAYGKGFLFQSDGRGLNTFSFGLTGGIGYCVTEVLEFGAAIAFNLVAPNPGTAGFDLALEPFAKFNLATVFGTGGINPYALVGPVFGVGQVAAPGASVTGVIGVDMDLGVEFFIERHWGVAAFVPIDIVATPGYGNTNFGIGVGFGLFGYLGSEPINIRIN
jgi:hypothetical protein